ncbi:MAG: hypothetical protein J6P28_03120 [Treponema sp.]|nr:hypothetical protein [Treponema sp.]
MTLTINKKTYEAGELVAYVEKLEKENAELKERCSILDRSLVTSTKNNIERQKIIDEIKEQLTKAKEIIRKYMNWADWKGSDCPSFANICIKAEQFLKEVVDK